MLLKKWDKLPAQLQTEEVRAYYDILRKRKISLLCKRLFDIFVSALLLILLSPVFLALVIAIKVDSKGPALYRQKRITKYGKPFRIHKFRSMVVNADQIGAQVTVDRDPRITKVGAFVRKYRLDELPQLIDVLLGDMTFVGTRPEVPKYVDAYTNEMLATLLLPAGITSEASIYFKDEAKLLNGEDTDSAYIEKVLPEKMRYNLEAIRRFHFWYDVKIMFKTVFAVFGKE